VGRLVNFKIWLENTELEYWGPYYRVDFDESYLIIYANDLDSPLYLPKNATFTYINKWPVGKTLNPPWNKYFKYYKDQSGKNVVTYTENRAVDVVCYNKRYNAIYLIKRNSPPIGIALPGGFFDNQADGFSANNPPSPESVGPIAASRELREETGANINPQELTPLGTFLTGSSDTREKTFRVWAYSYDVPDGLLQSFKYGDDASQAAGSETMAGLGYKGWYELDNIPNLSFPHHKEIINKIMS
jgi:ADP-ribose pyrophosphatase YjhB (NUDIX family)